MTGKKILILGSGMVAKPCVDYLLRSPNNTLTVACRTLSSAQKVAAGRARVAAVSFDVASPELDWYVASHDCVISLVPFVHHADVVRSAIRGKTNVAGITVLNEVGVDPGVDHLCAIKTIDEVHEKGGKVLEFYSYCGGLPAPEASHNPLRFKVVLLIAKRYLALTNMAVPYHVVDGYSFLAYPNRDSVPFREAYRIPEAQTVIRGSLRYEGSPALVKALIELGWLDTAPKNWLQNGMSWAEIQQKATGAASDTEADLMARVDELCTFSSPDQRGKVLAGTKNTITSTLELFGEPNDYSAMSKSVGLTCGIATQILLNGDPAFNKPGVLAPYSREICEPIRTRVEAEGIKLIEKIF
ncbi:hypothetical protein FAUST_3594 [Fusarium austroamericanum]|uniref:Saccharopine dehydrogenase n=1 Tax=Fusarium austroamericanum TaxID=282268 RepID=A0AAN6HHR4_FUSAU|nr:hypothetical protein FAUST_3594 [Fusarium austroamericanum]